MLGFGPLAFGVVQPWSICTLEVGTSVLLAVWVASRAIKGFHVAINPLLAPIALFASIVIAQLAFRRTAYWYETWSKAMLWASYAGLSFLASQLFRRQRWTKWFACFCVVYGFLLSLFAVIQQFTSNGKIYWLVPTRSGGWIYGPYVNHAHYAGLLEMLVPFPIILAIITREERMQRAMFLFVSVVSCSTIFLSQSLGGIIAFTVQIAVLALILWRNRRTVWRESIILYALCLGLAIWLLWLRPPGLVERFARMLNPISDAGVTGRIAILKDSLRMLWQRPVLGWGLGTFPDVYPSFRSFYTNFWVNEAHNDFAQTFVETGLAGFAAVTIFLVFLAYGGIQSIRHWRESTQSSITLAAFLGCIGLMVHGLCDFNLQIPANAAFFFTLAVLATAHCDNATQYQLSVGKWRYAK
ncbi:MAG: O-antigen ligase family protein [Acidobacteriaceae bacterium]|nr:O-antigen ligase family protein [Acidobacteriaceae bacterium]